MAIIVGGDVTYSVDSDGAVFLPRTVPPPYGLRIASLDPDREVLFGSADPAFAPSGSPAVTAGAPVPPNGILVPLGEFVVGRKSYPWAVAGVKIWATTDPGTVVVGMI